MLKSTAMYSNFWCGMTSDFYYTRTEDYEPIYKRDKIGCFSVPMVHTAVVVNLRVQDSDSLTFIGDKSPNYKGPVDDIITFAVTANLSGKQIINSFFNEKVIYLPTRQKTSRYIKYSVYKFTT